MKPDELKKWRQRNAYTQVQLAKTLGVDVMTVSRWERGVREIPSFLHLALFSLESREANRKLKKKRGGM
jgi:transcriptional regulator with XRE-family HTH domain